MEHTPEPQDLNLLTFPCLITVKIFFLNDPAHETEITQLIDAHIESHWFESWQCKQSSAGKYRSASAAINAQNREQIDALFRSLSAHDKVIMVI